MLLVSLSKERLELDQRTKAQTDPLTGALNRRAFMSRGERLLQRHAYERAPLCLLFLDLDHFKSLNDRFGHSGGDDVLTSFVGLVNACIRPTDFLFRIGGEEFCCLLPYTTTEQAHRVAERIRHQFEMTTIDGGGHAGEGDGKPRHRLDRCLRLRARHADAARRHGGLCRQARRPQPRRGGDAADAKLGRWCCRCGRRSRHDP